jgi:small GTP-binding protein
MEEEETFEPIDLSFLDEPPKPEVSSTDPMILLMGLDESGKTCLLSSLCYGEVVTSMATGLRDDTAYCHNGVPLVIRELGGRYRFRDDWPSQFGNARALIWVLDSIDRGRVFESRDEFEKLVRTPALADIPILFVLNKQDARIKLEQSQIMEWFDFPKHVGRKILVVGASKNFCPDVVDGLSWLVAELGLEPPAAAPGPEDE